MKQFLRAFFLFAVYGLANPALAINLPPTDAPSDTTVAAHSWQNPFWGNGRSGRGSGEFDLRQDSSVRWQHQWPGGDDPDTYLQAQYHTVIANGRVVTAGNWGWGNGTFMPYYE